MLAILSIKANPDGMETSGGFYPKEENLGKNCRFWDAILGCQFPKMEMQGRRSCEGVVDDVCLFIKNGRIPKSLTEEQRLELQTRIPNFNDKSYIPSGDTIK